MSLYHYVNLWFYHMYNMLYSSGLALPTILNKTRVWRKFGKGKKDGQRYRVNSIWEMSEQLGWKKIILIVKDKLQKNDPGRN